MNHSAEPNIGGRRLHLTQSAGNPWETPCRESKVSRRRLLVATPLGGGTDGNPSRKAFLIKFPFNQVKGTERGRRSPCPPSLSGTGENANFSKRKDSYFCKVFQVSATFQRNAANQGVQADFPRKAN